MRGSRVPDAHGRREKQYSTAKALFHLSDKQSCCSVSIVQCQQPGAADTAYTGVKSRWLATEFHVSVSSFAFAQFPHTFPASLPSGTGKAAAIQDSYFNLPLISSRMAAFGGAIPRQTVGETLLPARRPSRRRRNLPPSRWLSCVRFERLMVYQESAAVTPGGAAAYVTSSSADGRGHLPTGVDL